MTGKEPIKAGLADHDPPICEECERWASVIYKCAGTGFYDWWIETGYKAGMEVNVVYKCYKCAFGGED